ncbi:MAG: DUF1573 domain-containing protein [Cyclobacteriaceae bacterium]|nr:DUF1573 domain-containing protein [Cyclobacteriaceae bacterium]
MKKIGITGGLLLLLVGVLLAQTVKTLKFREEVYDFGNVIEEDGPVSHEFVFTNAGSKPAQIITVKPSCGCTTPGWSKEPVMPGNKGTIKAQFDPKGRPGFFSKSLTVTVEGESQPMMLQIKGTVISRDKFSSAEFQAASGNWRMRSLSFNLGKVYRKDEFMTREYEVVNAGTKPVMYLTKSDVPSHIRVSMDPVTIPAGGKSMLRISYNGKMKDQYGFQSDKIVLYTDDESQPQKTFTVYATLEDYFEELKPEELARAPMLRTAAQSIDFGSMRQNQQATRELTITNSGRSTLEIRSVIGNCTCVEATISKTELKPGESASMTVIFNPQDRKGTQNKSVTIYSNDPRNPVQRVNITAVVN